MVVRQKSKISVMESETQRLVWMQRATNSNYLFQREHTTFNLSWLTKMDLRMQLVHSVSISKRFFRLCPNGVIFDQFDKIQFTMEFEAESPLPLLYSRKRSFLCHCQNMHSASSYALSNLRFTDYWIEFCIFLWNWKSMTDTK